MSGRERERARRKRGDTSLNPGGEMLSMFSLDNECVGNGGGDGKRWGVGEAVKFSGSWNVCKRRKCVCVCVCERVQSLQKSGYCCHVQMGLFPDLRVRCPAVIPSTLPLPYARLGLKMREGGSLAVCLFFNHRVQAFVSE